MDKEHFNLGIGIGWGLVLILVLGIIFYPGDSIKTYDSILGKSIERIKVFPQCSDGIDNDGDLLIDFPQDIGCVDPKDNSEINAIGAGCGVGFDYGYPECKWEFVWTMSDRFANFDLSP